MNKTSVVLLLAFVAALPLRAAPPTQQSIDKLLEVAKVEKSLDLMTANLDKTLRQNVEQAMAGQTLTADDQKILDTFRGKMATMITDELSWTKIKDLYEQVYAATFTQAEIDSLIEFYQSPVGQMFADKQPEIAQKTTVLMQKRMIPVIVKLRTAVSDTINQIQAAHNGADEAPAAPATSAAPKTN